MKQGHLLSKPYKRTQQKSIRSGDNTHNTWLYAQKAPYVLVLGDKEVEEKKVTIEKRGGDGSEKTSIEDFVAKVTEEIKTRKSN